MHEIVFLGEVDLACKTAISAKLFQAKCSDFGLKGSYYNDSWSISSDSRNVKRGPCYGSGPNSDAIIKLVLVFDVGYSVFYIWLVHVLNLTQIKINDFLYTRSACCLRCCKAGHARYLSMYSIDDIYLLKSDHHVFCSALELHLILFIFSHLIEWMIFND